MRAVTPARCSPCSPQVKNLGLLLWRRLKPNASSLRHQRRCCYEGSSPRNPHGQGSSPAYPPTANPTQRHKHSLWHTLPNGTSLISYLLSNPTNFRRAGWQPALQSVARPSYPRHFPTKTACNILPIWKSKAFGFCRRLSSSPWLKPALQSATLRHPQAVRSAALAYTRGAASPEHVTMAQPLHRIRDGTLGVAGCSPRYKSQLSLFTTCAQPGPGRRLVLQAFNLFGTFPFCETDAAGGQGV